MGKIILFASGKGGTGKTTLTSHVGAALAASGRLTVLVDADVGFRNLDIALGLESSIVYDYSDYINGNSDFDDILIKSPDLENLYFVAAPQSASAADFNKKKAAKFWHNLKNRFDFILADAPAGMGDGFMFAAGYADEAVIVSLAETSSLRDADRVVDVLEDMGVETIRLVLNRIRPDLIERRIMMNVDDCVDVLSIPILGIVPEDGMVAESMIKGTPYMESTDAGAGKAFANIAKRLEGNQVPIMDFEGEADRGFIGKVRSFFRRQQ